MLSRILRPSLQAPLRLQRSLATLAPASNSSPSTSTSNSSLPLPPSIDSALRRSPALVGLVDDPLFRSSFGTVGRTMYEHGLDGEGSIGERFSQLYDSSRTLQVAIAEMRASNERLGVSDEDFQPVLTALFAKGGLQPFAPASASSPQSASGEEGESKEEKKHTGCGHNHAPGEKCS